MSRLWICTESESKMRNIIQGVKNLIAWFPVIWKDRDWDRSFLLRILQFKLKRMLPEIENGHSVGCKKEAHKMRIAIWLLERQIDTIWYYDNALMFHRKKYGEPNFSFPDGVLNITYPDAQDNEEADREAKRVLGTYWKHKNQDWEFLMDLLKRNLRSWWD